MRTLCIAALILLFASTLFAQDRDKVESRLDSAGTVLDEIMAAPDNGIPSDILDSAKCVAVVPSLLKGGFIVGAAYGKGFATCRTETGWSAPAPFGIKGGSFGLQIGGEAVDYVMLVMNDKGMRALLSSKFKIGGDISGAAGPVGRHAEASTDWKLRAEVLTYSRARGVFAGVTLNGAVVSQDTDDTRALYGHRVPFKTILLGHVAAPSGSEAFLGPVQKYSPTKALTPAADKEVPQNPPPPDNNTQPANPPKNANSAPASGSGDKPSAYNPPEQPK